MFYQIAEEPPGIPADFKDLQENVRRHGNSQRQRARGAVNPICSLVRGSVSAFVLGAAHAGITDAVGKRRYGTGLPLGIKSGDTILRGPPAAGGCAFLPDSCLCNN